MLRIKIDKESDRSIERTRTTCILLNDKLSHTPEDQQVMFAIPYFKMGMYALYKEGETVKGEDPSITQNRPFHVFVVH